MLGINLKALPHWIIDIVVAGVVSFLVQHGFTVDQAHTVTKVIGLEDSAPAK